MATALVALLALAGCRDDSVPAASVGMGGISTWHDQQRGVTCWVFEGYNKGGISCLPDWMLERGAPVIFGAEPAQ